MTNTDMLEDKISRSGYKKRYIAECCGISYQGLMNKIHNKSEFKAPEIKILCDILNITVEEKEAIFFN